MELVEASDDRAREVEVLFVWPTRRTSRCGKPHCHPGWCKQTPQGGGQFQPGLYCFANKKGKEEVQEIIINHSLWGWTRAGADGDFSSTMSACVPTWRFALGVVHVSEVINEDPRAIRFILCGG